MNLELIAIEIGDSVKDVTSVNEINRIANAIFKFPCSEFPNTSITSERAQLIYNWILSLQEHDCSIDEKKELLIAFAEGLGPNLLPLLHSFGVGVSEQNPLDRFDACQFHPEIKGHCRKLYGQENYFHAVFEAAKMYNNLVKSKTGGDDDGEKLMLRAWDPNKGSLKISSGTSKTDINFQEGIKFLSAGLIRAVRNPTAHESHDDWPINQQDATDILSLISFLLRQYDKAIQNLNEDANTHYNRGIAYGTKGELDKAIQDYSKAITLNPEDAWAYNNRGVVYHNIGDFAAAIEDYSKAIELDPHSNTYCNRGEAWLHLKEWQKAKADLTTAKDMGCDIIASFQNEYESVENFEARNEVEVPEDIAALLQGK